MGSVGKRHKAVGTATAIRRRGPGRALVLVLALTVALSACSSTSKSGAGSNQPADTATVMPTRPTYHNAPLQTGTASPTDLDPLTSAGTPSLDPSQLRALGQLTVQASGSSITTDVAIGPALPNTQSKPPTDVLDACNWNYPTSIAQSVYIHGSLTITYSGSIAEAVGISQPNVIDLTSRLQFGAGQAAGVGIQGPDGAWHGCGSAQDWSYVMQPGQHITADMWIDYMELSNSHPTFDQSDVGPLAIQFAAGGTATSASGPSAVNCKLDVDATATPTLLLYAVPPYRYTANDINGTAHAGTCAPA